MHCIYPYYLGSNYDNKYPAYVWFVKPSCNDKSDQIHKVNTKCTADAYITTYCKTFCPEGVEILTDKYFKQKYFIDKEGKKLWRGLKCDSLCSNTTAWLSKNIANTSLVDPRHCQDSCAEPGYG